eukprot:8749070-Alexandrium_andersonii.AAC.1
MLPTLPGRSFAASCVSAACPCWSRCPITRCVVAFRGATDVAAFHLRQFFNVARRSGRVAGALFVDVSGAYDA